MKDLVNAAALSFTKLLERRIHRGVLTTEDSVRFTFYAALLADGRVLPEQVVMEYPHPKIDGARVDTVLLDNQLVPVVAMEFKYDREIPSGRNVPKPQKAGAIFRDMVRLLAVPSMDLRLLVHLSSQELAGYWSELRNGLSGVFGLKVGNAIEITGAYFSGRSETFHKSMGTWPGIVDLSCLVSATLRCGHELRMYLIEQRQRIPPQPVA